ncbi:hypothetical protein EBU99_10210 [bacterium]|nr:hypothetical protein [bacterium]
MVEHGNSARICRGSPELLSKQLGVPVEDVLEAITFAQIAPLESDEGVVEYELQTVVAAYLENKLKSEPVDSSALQRVLRLAIEDYQDSTRQMLREENRLAYQIKEATESRLLEVLGQVSVSMGRVEAFVGQAARILSQLDLRLARLELNAQNAKGSDAIPFGITTQAASSDAITRAGAEDPTARAAQLAPPQRLSNAELWTRFEVFATRAISAHQQTADAAAKEFLATVKIVLNMGSLELKLNGDSHIEKLRPVIETHFQPLLASLPEEAEVLPAFELYNGWMASQIHRGQPAILLFLVVLLQRGGQISWSGFVNTFVHES